MSRSALRSLTPSLTALVLAASVVACGKRDPQTDAEKAARGRELVAQMDAKLAGAKAFSVHTNEARTQVRQSGKTEEVPLQRDFVIRRPDRLHFKSSGGQDAEGWYDGVGLTVALHKQKVFAQARMPETLDRALDAIQERYGISLPVGDLLYSSPAKALITDGTQGGWVGQETINGVSTEHVAFTDRGVEWALWIPSTGDPLPVRLIATFPNDKRTRHVDVTFSNWNLSPAADDKVFDASVPPDYEGIAMIQRASVLAYKEGAQGTTPAAPAAAPTPKK
jgi:hypothetical protein